MGDIKLYLLDTLNDNSHKIMTTKRRASSFSKGTATNSNKR